MSDVSVEEEQKSSSGQSDSKPKPRLLNLKQGIGSGQEAQSKLESSISNTPEKKVEKSEPTPKDTGTPTSPPTPSTSGIGVTLSKKPGKGESLAPTKGSTEKTADEVGRITAMVYANGMASVVFEGEITGRVLNNQILRGIMKEMKFHRAQRGRRAERKG